jgi:type IV pilus assembly protein PilZ
MTDPKDEEAAVSDDDRRRSARAPIELKVEYKRLNSFFADYTRNISRGGTFIRTAKPLDIGTEFTFKLVVPKLEKPLELRGKVQWMVRQEDADPDAGQEPGMGIGFIYATEAERQKIEGIVERLMVDSLGPILYEKLMRRRDAGDV